MKNTVLIACLLSMLSLVGCSWFDSDEPEPTLFPDDIRFSFFENADAGGQLMLRVETTNEYTCSNFAIITEQELTNGNMLVHLTSVESPAVCLTALGPAVALLNVNEGVTQLSFTRNGTFDDYFITITESVVEVQVGSATFSTPTQLQFTR